MPTIWGEIITFRLEPIWVARGSRSPGVVLVVRSISDSRLCPSGTTGARPADRRSLPNCPYKGPTNQSQPGLRLRSKRGDPASATLGRENIQTSVWCSHLFVAQMSPNPFIPCHYRFSVSFVFNEEQVHVVPMIYTDVRAFNLWPHLNPPAHACSTTLLICNRGFYRNLFAYRFRPPRVERPLRP